MDNRDLIVPVVRDLFKQLGDRNIERGCQFGVYPRGFISVAD